jgi:hypothetical protein
VGRLYPGIDARLAGFVESQPVFFVASAPLDADGHVNCSPKGNNGSFTVLDEHRAGYLDLTGSGIETIAHIQENRRIVLMFCAFVGPPRIVRFHGTAEAVPLGDPRFEGLLERFAPNPGARAVVVVTVERISDSCGYGVPIMEFQRHRDNIDHWVDTKGPDGLVSYRAEKNAESIDGLPGIAQVGPQRSSGLPTAQDVAEGARDRPAGRAGRRRM